VDAWQVAGTVAAIVFGTIGAAVAITKLTWDRRDRRLAEQRKAEEAELLTHERERLRREQAQWEAADQAEDEAHRLRIYSEAEAREFLRQPRAPSRAAGRGVFGFALGVVVVLAVVAGLVWVVFLR
jgi:Flp pilus assembly protein TadB